MIRALVVGAAMVLWVVLFWAVTARAHDAPSGWPYPTACCHGTHCSPLPRSDVEVTADGYLIVPTGEVVPFGEANTSPDGEFHYCSLESRHQTEGAEHFWREVLPTDRNRSAGCGAYNDGYDGPSYSECQQSTERLNRSERCFFAPEHGS